MNNHFRLVGHRSGLMTGLAVTLFNSLGATQALAQESPVLEEIIVTAQKREESVQTVPVAVSVLTGAALERANATNISDLTALTPSVTFTSGFEGRDNAIRIRGVGTDIASVGVESSVSTVMDGVVLHRPGAAFSDLGDVERVEVLRGPQGTLFGKNSAAGVISVVTKSPTFGEPEGSVGLLVAQDKEVRLNAVYSAPISDTLAFRVAASARTQDGIIKNVYTGNNLGGSDAQSVRAKLTFRPTDSLEFKLSADYSNLQSDAGASPLFVYTPSSALVPLPTAVGITLNAENDKVDNDVEAFVDQKNYGGSVETNLKLGEHTVTMINSLRRFSNLSDFDLDNSRAQLIIKNDNLEVSKTSTHELRLTSPTGGFIDYVIGALYFDSTATNTLYRYGLNIGAVTGGGAINPVTGAITPRIATDSAATGAPFAGYATIDVTNLGIYSQANLHPTDKLTVTAGLRYIDEQQDYDFKRFFRTFFNGSDAAATAQPFLPAIKRFGDTEVIGKASVQYQFTDDLMTYLSYSTGYVGQGTSSGLGTQPAEFNAFPTPPTTSNLVELGFKSQFLNNRMQLNAALFRTRFEDYQARVQNPTTGLLALTNAGTVGVDGVEVEFAALVGDGLSINGGVTYSDARFLGTYAACNAVQNAARTAAGGGNVVALGCGPLRAVGTIEQSLDGKPFMNAPDWRATLSGRYQFPVGEQSGHVQLGYRWQSKVNFDISQNPFMVQKSYGVADLSAGLVTSDKRFEYGVFVKNLLDQEYRMQVLSFNSAAVGGTTYAQQIARDFHRYVGANFKVNF